MRVHSRIGGLFGAIVLASAIPVVPAVAVSPNIVISQIYGNGGLAGSAYTHDFIELFNRGTTPVSVLGWSLQYAGPTSGSFGSTSSTNTPLGDFTIQPGQYFLVQGAPSNGAPTTLPTPDRTDPTPTNLSPPGGKVALVTGTTGLGCSSLLTCSQTQLDRIVDLVGYGTANFYEGNAAAPALFMNSGQRAENGCTDTDQNAADFTIGTPAPRNSASPVNPCGGPNAEVEISCGDDITTDFGTPVAQPISAHDEDGTVVGIGIDSVTPSPATGSISTANLSPASGPGGTATADLVVSADLAVGTYLVNITAANSDNPAQTDSCAVAVTVHDVLPPSITLSATPDLLWPPNHKLRPVEVTATVTDDHDPAPVFELVSVTSNEPDNAPGIGDGNTVNDIVMVDADSFLLRAERAGNGTGRIYTITYRAVDAAGNAAVASVEVFVPLNASK